MEKYRKTQYDSIIYPAVFGKKRDVQLSFIDDDNEVEDNTDDINIQGSKLGRGRKVLNPSIRKARERRERPIEGQETLFDDEEEDMT